MSWLLGKLFELFQPTSHEEAMGVGVLAFTIVGAVILGVLHLLIRIFT